jgi:hypothetical protein
MESEDRMRREFRLLVRTMAEDADRKSHASKDMNQAEEAKEKGQREDKESRLRESMEMLVSLGHPESFAAALLDISSHELVRRKNG